MNGVARLGRWAVVIATVPAAGMWMLPLAAADSTESLRSAVVSARSGSCATTSEPVVEQTAAIVNQSTASFLDYTARAEPVQDPMTVLKDLGYSGNKAKMLQGAGSTDGDAIKGALLQGFAVLRDCSFTDYGASVVFNEMSGNFLSVVVLAGP